MSADTLAVASRIDPTNYDREPIHIPGAIQPHGVLLALEEWSLRVVMASRNAGVRLVAEGADVLGKTLDLLVDDASMTLVRQALLASDLRAASPLKLTARAQGNASFDGILHRSSGLVVLELEPALRSADISFSDFYRHVRSATTRLQRTTDVTEMCEIAVTEVQRITGFDRVMAYRFDRDDHGHVIAERKREDLPSFLDLHYPASDITAQARRLHAINRLRSIADVGARPTPIEPATNPATGAPLDLSFAVLRSASPIQLEYLRNVGVEAAMSISLMRGSRLWGMIICHHYSPRFVSYEVRSACEFWGQALSWQVASHERGEDAEKRSASQAVLAKLIDHVVGAPDFATGLVAEPSALLGLTNAEGVAIRFDGRWSTFGRTPDPARLDALAKWVKPRTAAGFFASDAIRRLDANAPPIDELASGVLWLTTSPERDECIAWFRPEVVRTVSWAGDPRKPGSLTDGAPRVSPPGSFALWKETVRGAAIPWQPWELDAARDLRLALAGSLLRRNEELVALNARLQETAAALAKSHGALESQVAERTAELASANAALNERAADLARSNLELERFAYVASHDLQEPLRMVVSYVQLIERRYNDKLDANAKEFIAFAVDGAKRMQALINDLLAFSRVGRTEGPRTLADSGIALGHAIANLRVSIEESKAKITHPPDFPPVQIDLRQLTQVFQNMIANAIKFKGSEPPEIAIAAERDEDGESWRFTVRDNGIGIAPQYLERIFVIFQRLHTREQYPGTGMGLAIAKKIVEQSGGKIGVESAPGHGSTFWFTLPGKKEIA